MNTPDEQLIEHVREWVASAGDDRDAIRLLLDGGGPIRVVAFHAQQAVEKLMKALLISYGIEPDEVHIIGNLLAQLDRLDRSTVLALGAVDRLTPYAVLIRYPPRPGRLSRSTTDAQIATDIGLAQAACEVARSGDRVATAGAHSGVGPAFAIGRVSPSSAATATTWATLDPPMATATAST